MKESEWAEQYQKEYLRYEKLTLKFKALLEELLARENIKAIVEARTKDIESFKGKISRPEKAYQNPLIEITDFSGLRIIVNALNDIDTVIKLIKREFNVDEKRSINKIETLQFNEFGYLSHHFIVRVHETRSKLSEWSDVNTLWAEIQVRTVLQHAWAIVSHSMDYKTELDVPKAVRRRLFRLSALFELADEEFVGIIHDKEECLKMYKHEMASDGTIIDLNVDSLKTYIEKSTIIDQYKEFIESLGIIINGIGMISRDVEMARYAGIETITQLDGILKSSRSWGFNYLKEFFYNTWGEVIPRGCSIDINGVVTLFIIGNYLDVFSSEILDKKFGWGLPERAINPARKYSTGQNSIG